MGAGVVEQDLVEGRTPDLVGVGPGAVGLPEVPAPGFGVASPEHRRAPLFRESGGLYLLEDAEVLEDGHGGGQQGLADVFAGEAFALQEGHIKASAGEEGGGGAAAGASAYYYDVCVFGRSDVRVSVFYLRLEPYRKSLSQGIGGRQILASHSPPLGSRLRGNDGGDAKDPFRGNDGGDCAEDSRRFHEDMLSWECR